MRFKRRLTHRVRRFAAWLKQVVLLGRADWHKASDDSNPPRLSRLEREQLRPSFDPNVIKPRMITGAERTPVQDPMPSAPLRPQVDPPPEILIQPSRVRRRRRSNQTAVNPLSACTPDKLPASKLAVFVEKFFGRRD